jgi:hypothetical protein
VLAIATAGVAFLELGLSTSFEIAFADEHPSPEASRERVAHNDRLATLVLVAGLAAGLAVTLAVRDASVNTSPQLSRRLRTSA